MAKSVAVSVGDQVFVERAAEPFGAVRHVSAHDLVVNVENFGDVSIGAEAVRSVHDGKVIVDLRDLPPDVRAAITRAHRAEDR